MAESGDPIMWTRGKTIGRGKFGVVTLASITTTLDLISVDIPSTIAVKSALYSRSRSLQKERDILHEFQDCQQIIRCFGADVTEEDGKMLYNMLLEYACGGSLADRIGQSSGQGLPEYEVKKYATSILLGLSELHRRGFVHCDIKPQNILLVGTEKVAKIADFGFAKKIEQTHKRKRGGLKGTPMYMAPESVLDDVCGPEADIWAFGCTVFEMITGKLIWDCNGINEAVYLLCKIGMESPDLQNDKLSKEAEDFLKKCLDRNPSSRWSADMLLKHPFLLSDDAVREERWRKELSLFFHTEVARETEPFMDDLCDSAKLKPMKLLSCRSSKSGRTLLEGC